MGEASSERRSADTGLIRGRKGGGKGEEEEGGKKLSPVRRGINLSCHGQISTKEADHPGSVPTAATSRHPGRKTGRIPWFNTSCSVCVCVREREYGWMLCSG